MFKDVSALIWSSCKINMNGNYELLEKVITDHPNDLWKNGKNPVVKIYNDSEENMKMFQKRIKNV